MHIFGITGGIATGKSTVTRMLAELGAPTISADAIAHDLLAPGTAITKAVLAAFPACADPAYPDLPTIDRRALGRLIFADETARIHLEALTHPAIIAALQSQIAGWRMSDEAPAAAAEIPLLFEAGLQEQVDQIIVVACDENQQRARLLGRARYDERQVEGILAAQWPLAEKITKANVVITTNKILGDTKQQVEALWASLSR